MGIASITLTGILMLARQRPVPDWLFLWELGANSTIYRISLDDQPPERLTATSLGGYLSPWLETINGYLYFEAIGKDGSRHLYRLPMVGGRVQQITPPDGVFVTFSPDRQWVYYHPQDNDFALHRVRVNGSQSQRVIEGVELEECLPAPVGDWLACDSGPRDPSFIYIMRPDGSEFRNLVPDSEARPAGFSWAHYLLDWSPDGQWLTLWGVREGLSKLYRIRPDGSNLQALTDGMGAEISRWMNDDASLYYQTFDAFNSTLTGVEAAGNAVPQTLIQGHFAALPITFSDEWVYVPMLGDLATVDIYQIARDGSHSQKLISLSESRWIIGPSPDDEWLYLSVWVDENAELMRLNLDSLQMERLTQTPGHEMYGFWSRDGQWLLYGATPPDTNVQALWAMRADGSDAHALLHSQMFTDITQFAVWSSPSDFAWHALWPLVMGAGLLAASFALFGYYLREKYPAMD